MHSRENVLATLKDDLSVRLHVARIGVFGPVSRGEQTPASDIDIAVLSSPGRSAHFAFTELEEHLPDCAGVSYRTMK